MVIFKQVELSDKEWINKLLRQSDLRSADFNFTNMYLWSHLYASQVAEYEGRLLIKLSFGDCPIYSYPVGSGPLKPVVDELLQDAKKHNAKLTLRGITCEILPELESLYPDQFDLFSDPASYDYVYSAEKLASLEGKKLHAKRNHINRFLEQNNWSFEPLTASNVPECVEMTCLWMTENEFEKHTTYNEEAIALKKMFNNFEVLGLNGGVLRSDGKVIAFTAGDMLNSDTYNVHFEKAFSHIQGAYAMINREFVRYIRQLYPQVVYIDREEDLGIESLRKAKQSYYPEFQIKKYSAIWR